MIYILFIIGFVFLIKGADFLIEGASSIAKKFQVSDLVIGLSIVAIGTSAPEFVVNMFASYHGNAELAISNILGSNIANTFIAIGLAAVISPLVVKRNTVLKEIPLCLLAAIMVGVLANDVLIDGDLISHISRIDGFVFLGFFMVFFSYTMSLAKDKREEPLEKIKTLPTIHSILYIVLGIIGLSVGGDWIVDGAVKIASSLGMSQALIGVTIIAVGTSLPEIVTSAMSAMKGYNDIAIGNAVGSNILNIFFILGVSSLVRPLDFDTKLNFDIMVNIGAAALLFLFLYVFNKKHTLSRWHGILFLGLYSVYLTFAILRG